MSYDIELRDPITGETLELNAPHYMRGGTYAACGESRACLNITYNYGQHLHRVMPGGIRGLYGKTGAESLPILDAAIAALGDDVDEDYWRATEGNTKRALTHVRALATMRPDGVWYGD